jgi:ElaB/YqjD/DUF883 family membrane-anchored ribosome-binding protein
MVVVNKPVAGGKSARTAQRRNQNQKPITTARAAESTPAERDAAPRVDFDLGQYVREQPLQSLLIAACAGLVLGRFWLRR